MKDIVEQLLASYEKTENSDGNAVEIEFLGFEGTPTIKDDVELRIDALTQDHNGHTEILTLAVYLVSGKAVLLDGCGQRIHTGLQLTI